MKSFISCLLITVGLMTILFAQDELTPEQERALFRECKERYGKDNLETAICYNDLGLICKENKQYHLAKRYFEAALAIRMKKLDENHLDIAALYTELGYIHYGIEDYESAKNHHEKSLAIKIQNLGDKHMLVAASYFDLAKTYKALFIYNTAKDYYEKSLAIFKKHLDEDNILLGMSYIDLAAICSKLGDYKQSKLFYEKSLVIYKKNLGDNDINIAVLYNDLALVYSNLGDYEEAKNYHEKSLSIRIQNLEDDDVRVATSYYNLAMAYTDLCFYDTAKDYYEKALAIRIRKLGKDDVKVANCYAALGSFYRKLGDYKQAKMFQEKSITAYRQTLGEEDIRVAASYGGLAALYRILGDYEHARMFYEKSLIIRKKILGEDHPRVATAYHNLAIFWQELGDYERSGIYYTKSLDIMKRKFGEEHLNVATCYDNLGSFYTGVGDYKQAEMFLEKSLSIKEKNLHKYHDGLASTYNNIGEFYRLQGVYDLARDYYEKSLNIMTKLGKNHVSVAIIYNNLGLTYKALGTYNIAKDCYEKSINIELKKIGKENISVSKSYINLTLLYEEMGLYQQADSLWLTTIPKSLNRLRTTYLFLPEKQRISYQKTTRSTHNYFYSFAYNIGNNNTKELALKSYLNTKSLALDYSINTRKLIEQIDDDSLSNTFQQLNILNDQIAKGEVMSNDELKKRGWDLQDKRGEQQTLATRILQHPMLRKKLGSENIEWQNIQNSLKVDEASLDFIRICDSTNFVWSYHAFLIRKDSPTPQFIRLVEEDTIKESLQIGEDIPIYLKHKSANKQLYQRLWQPLETHLKGIKTIHISPAGLLNKVAFEALSTNGKYLEEKYEFHYYSAMRDMLSRETQRPDYKDILLAGHIIYDLSDTAEYKKREDTYRGFRDGFSALPNTLEEVKVIDSIATAAKLTSTLLTSAMPTEDKIKSLTGEQASNICHIASHGTSLPALKTSDKPLTLIGSKARLGASDNPLQRSLIALYGANHRWTKNERTIYTDDDDGILTALEVSGLDLSKTNLVVLSACQTGLGEVDDTEGVFGLQRAFKLAGVENVIVSLWNVSDAATKELMILFILPKSAQ